MGAGVVMMAGGIVGMVVCMILLCILPGIFEKQRKSCSVKLKMRFSSRERTSVYEK